MIQVMWDINSLHDFHFSRLLFMGGERQCCTYDFEDPRFLRCTQPFYLDYVLFFSATDHLSCLVEVALCDQLILI